MTPSFGLPVGLAPWSTMLSHLDPRLAIALGPMVRGLDDLVSRGEAAAADDGVLDGYAGLSRHGEPHRIVASEWALASEFPLEFLRRAANAELLHLEPNRISEPVRGRVAVLLDTGADQLGAARLVQLATLVVLQRRAERRGTELAVAFLGDPAGNWRTGAPRALLDAWLRNRRADRAVGPQVDEWSIGLEASDEMWALVGPALAAQLPGRRRLVVTTELGWSSSAATSVEVIADGRRAELALPAPHVGVRALRTALLRPHRDATASSTKLHRLSFTDHSAALLSRTSSAGEIVRISVPKSGDTAGRVRRHQFSGPVVTAALIGRRLVALVSRGDRIVVEVHGKPLASLDGVSIAVADFALSSSDVAHLCSGPLGSVVFDSGGLTARLGDVWFSISDDGRARVVESIVDVLPRAKTDEPLIARRHGDRVMVTFRGAIPARADPIVLGAGELAAWVEGEGRWHVAPNARSVILGAGETVLAVHIVDDAPALVTLSASGLIVRLRWPAGERVLTAYSGGAEPPTVHRTRPWVGALKTDGSVVVGDFATGERLLTLRSGA